MTTKTKKPLFVRKIAKADLLVVLSPMPKLGDGVRLHCNSKGLIRTYKQDEADPRLNALGLPIVGDEFKVVNLLTARKRCITTARVLKAICHVSANRFAEPIAYKPRAKPTRKVPSIRQLIAKYGEAAH